MQSSSVEVLSGNRHRVQWAGVLGGFEDANLYQTWEYGCHRYGERALSTLVVNENGSPVSAALVRVVSVPLLRRGIAYVRWGPLWKRAGAAGSPEAFARGVRALRQEYVGRRGLVLRIRPYLFAGAEAAVFEDILRAEGFAAVLRRPQERTLIVDLMKPLEDLRKGLAPKWRNHLNGAEKKQQLRVIEGTEDSLFGRFAGLYHELVMRKQFSEVRDVDEFSSIQRDLPDHLKMRVFLCEGEGSLCAGIVCSAIGSTGVTLLRATSPSGMQSKAAYLIQWRALQWLKEAGCSHYDLSGINPEENPGTYAYKAGLCGKNGRDLVFLPQFEAHPGPISRIALPLLENAFLVAKGLRGRVARVLVGSTRRESR